MKDNFSRFFFGLFYFLAFILVLIFAVVLFNPAGFSLDSILGRTSSLFNLQKTYDNTTSLFTREVVQEESVVTDVVEQVSPSVVSIVIKTYDFDIFEGPSSRESGIGTGFIVDSNGLIITNSHVVEDPEGEYSVVLKDGTTYDVEKIHLDEITDIAILEITARNLPVVRLGNSDDLKVGQRAIAIGNALGQFQNTVTVGVVSGISRQIVASGGFGQPSKVYESVLQTDAALNPGNSGGPLLNSFGQVIGVNVATTAGADNISFAIPINAVKPILEGFLRDGRIVRPYLGVYYSMISDEIARLRDLPVGAYVSRVVSESPAQEAGLNRGDIILSIQGQALDTEHSLASVLSKFKVGDRVELEVDREGEIINVIAQLEEAPQAQAE